MLCNDLCAGSLDRVVGKALPRQVAGGLRPGSAPGADPGGPKGLRPERVQRCFDGLPGDATQLEVVPDEEVARSPVRESLRPGSGEALVVHRAGVRQSFDCLGPGGGRDVRSIEPRGELSRGQVTVAECARGPRHGLVSLQLAAYPARALSVDLHTDVETRLQGDLGGQRPPRLTVERDLDAAP